MKNVEKIGNFDHAVHENRVVFRTAGDHDANANLLSCQFFAPFLREKALINHGNETIARNSLEVTKKNCEKLPLLSL